MNTNQVISLQTSHMWSSGWQVENSLGGLQISLLYGFVGSCPNSIFKIYISIWGISSPSFCSPSCPRVHICICSLKLSCDYVILSLLLKWVSTYLREHSLSSMCHGLHQKRKLPFKNKVRGKEKRNTQAGQRWECEVDACVALLWTWSPSACPSWGLCYLCQCTEVAVSSCGSHETTIPWMCRGWSHDGAREGVIKGQ